MLKKTKLVSLILLSGALAVPVGAFAEIAPEKQSVSVSQQSGKVSGVVEDALGPITGATLFVSSDEKFDDASVAQSLCSIA